MSVTSMPMSRRRHVSASLANPLQGRSRLAGALLPCVLAQDLHAQGMPDTSTMPLENLLDVEIATASRFEQSIPHAQREFFRRAGRGQLRRSLAGRPLPADASASDWLAYRAGEEGRSISSWDAQRQPQR